jgi:methylated-DNA-[protein]-cysteine S-methyltransferase
MTDIERTLTHLDPGRPPAFDVDRADADGLVDVAWAALDSPVGPVVVAATPAGVVRIAYAENDPDDVLTMLAARLSPRVVEAPAKLDPVRRALDEYFEGRRRSFDDLRLDWSLVGPFAKVVLTALQAVPFGAVTSYGGLSAAIGKPKAARAVGNALGSNPIPIVVPCHRVLRGGGKLGGYTGGLDIKRHLLALEGTLPPEEDAAHLPGLG